MNAFDIPPTQIEFQDYIPRMAQQLWNVIANMVYAKPRTAGAVFIGHDTERQLP